MNQVWEKIHTLVTDYRRQHPDAEICFTGHSLGASLAVLAFSRFADPNISLYTFGCPRIGDAAFRDRVLSNNAKGIYRYVNFNDAVAHVPTESLLYRQTPEKCYRFDGDGNLDIYVMDLGTQALTRLTDDQIWSRGAPHENSIANLILHLCGNVRQWIGAGVGGLGERAFQRAVGAEQR